MVASTDSLRTALAGRYGIEREIGRGGMATVYLATDVRHRRPVALKVLHDEVAAAAGAARFLREIEIAAHLTHPHILPLHDSGEADGVLFYVMPYVAGGSLRARLARDGGRLPMADAVRIAREVAAALAHAHAAGVVHRDVKPENILLHDDGTAVVADFGIARALTPAVRDSTLTQVGLALGTPAYVSPEQALGEREIDGRSDVYSLGCVLYEMLAGRPPYDGATAQAVILKHCTAPVPRVADAPSALVEVVTRALAKDPSERFATAAELARALDEARSGESRPAAVTAQRGDTPVPAAAAHGVVAVLPFANLSPDAAGDWFTDGITEDLITQLSKIGSLRVISRTSAMRYKGTSRSLREIGSELGAGALLEGSVRRAGDRLRVNARLVDAASDAELWAERYDRQMTDVFEVQGEVAERIAEAMNATLSNAERARITRSPTHDLEAYNLYLLGRHHWARWTSVAEFHQAIDYYEQAIARDPGYAAAWAGLAEARMHLGAGYFGIRPRDAYPQARAAAARAIALNPQSAEAHVAAATANWWFTYDCEDARRHLQHALALSPSSASAHDYLANVLMSVGRHDDAILMSERACKLDPLSYFIMTNAALLLYRARRYDDALAAFRRTIALDPDLPMAHALSALPLVLLGRPEEALAEIRVAEQKAPHPAARASLAYGCAAAGRPAEARALLAEIEARRSDEFPHDFGLAMAYTVLGDHDTALARLEQAYEDRGAWMVWLGVEPALDPLRGHPRFRALLGRMGLSDEGRFGVAR
jgi:serine/threonine-protein kinase